MSKTAGDYLIERLHDRASQESMVFPGTLTVESWELLLGANKKLISIRYRHEENTAFMAYARKIYG